MSGLLSQDEVDVLLKGISAGDAPQEEAPEEESFAGRDHPAGEPSPEKPSEVAHYDWTSSQRSVSGKSLAVELLSDRFARELAGTISTTLRQYTEVTPISWEVKKFEAFTKTLPVPTSIHSFSIEPLEGMPVMVLDGEFTYRIIELLLGGSGEGGRKLEGQEFTSIESGLINRMVREILKDFEKSWQFLSPVRVNLEASGINPKFVSSLAPSENVLCIEMEVDVEVFIGSLFICLPYAMIEPFRNATLTAERKNGRKKDLRREQVIMDHLTRAEVELSVDLGGSRISVKEFMNLKAGDTLILDCKTSDPAQLKVEGVPKFLGYPGRFNGSWAIKVSGALNPARETGLVKYTSAA